MTFVGGIGLGAPASGLRFATTRGRIQGSPAMGVNYPSPFFDVAHTYLPTTVKALFRWCRYYFVTNPLVNATAFKLSEYPVTDVVVDHENDEVKRLWEDYLHDQLKYQAFRVEVGLDYHVYGNGFVGLSFPFHKILTCTQCGFQEQAKKIRDRWVFTNYAFRLNCPQCGNIGESHVKDFYIKDPSGIRLIRWNPEDIEVSYNDITGQYTYFYTIPGPLRNDIVVGKKDVVESIPQIFIQALKQAKGIVFNKDMIFHLRRPTLATKDRGWGTPLLLPVLKDAFYLQLMKKAQEAILLEHIIPLRVLFPQAGSGSSDPYTTVNLETWREHVAQEIARWRLDNAYIPILPLPIGQETIGGDGRALLLTNEMQVVSEYMLNGMMVPLEFVKGGLSYAGTNVSMRMMENMFIGYNLAHKHLLRFVMGQIAVFLDWPPAKGRFKPFKMADDLQRLALMFQANGAGKISDTTFLGQIDLSQTEETKIKIKETAIKLEATEKEQLAMADIQGKSQLIMMKYQTKAQVAAQQEMTAPQAPGEPGGVQTMQAGTPGGQPIVQGQGATSMPAEGGIPGDVQSQINVGQDMQQTGPQIDMQSWAMVQAQMLAQMPESQRQMAIQNLQAQNPSLAGLVQQLLKQITGGSQGASAPQADLRPLPDKLPPRRAAQIV